MKFNWPFGTLCLALGFGLGFLCFNFKQGAIPVTAAKSSQAAFNTAPPATNTHRPWGYVESLKIPFADSHNIFPDRAVRLQKPQWFFQDYSPAKLTEFLLSCGIDDREQNELQHHSPVQIATNGCLMHPSDDLIRSLHSTARGKIYSVLEKSSFNYPQQYPFRFLPTAFESRFEGSGLPADKLAILRSLTYTNGGDLCLADIQTLSQTLSPDEFERAIDAIYRFPVYRLRLRMFHDSDVESVVKYWGRGGREERIRPLISSLAKVPKDDGTSIGISYLLPTFARLHLYTFPNVWNGPDVSKQDCFWSSMNFFNETPNDAFFNGDHVTEVLQSKYHLIHDSPKLGDLIVLFGSLGEPRHMCVYLADDFVFTKNGSNILAPWVIMKTADMLLMFPSQLSRTFVIYRRNDLS